MRQVYRDLLVSVESRLRAAGLQDPAREAQILLKEAAHITPLQEGALPLAQLEALERAVERRCQREPLAYILGHVPFLGLEIQVDRRALIPRPETEILADLVLHSLSKKKITGRVPQLLDLCCGSGCLAVALGAHLSKWAMCASDLSPEALELAEVNARGSQVPVLFKHGDLLAPWQGWRFDAIVCNPPYIARREWQDVLEPEVQQEPALALFGGEDGLLFYRRLKEDLLSHLQPHGEVWLEIGFDQGDVIRKMFSCMGRGSILKDLSGCDRFFRLEVGAGEEL